MTAEWLVRLHRDQPVVGSIPLLYESKQRSIHVRCRGAHGCAMFGLAEAKTGSKGFCGTAVLRSCGPAALWHCILSRVTPKYQNLTTYPSTNLLRRVESSVILEYVSNDNFKNFGGAVLSYSDCYLFQDYWFSPF